MVRTPTSIEKSAQLQGTTPEEYIKNFVCRHCQSKKVTQKTEPEPQDEELPKKGSLVMTKLCQSCVNTCKVYTISEKATLGCPKYHKKVVNDTGEMK